MFSKRRMVFGAFAALALVALAPGCSAPSSADGGTGGGTGGGAGDGGTTYEATLSGAQETPPVETSATGSATFTLDAAQTTLTYSVTHTVSGATGAHVHTGFAGEAGAVTLPFTSVGATMTGSFTVTAQMVSDLKAGKLYVNVHSPTHAGGEIRGQLLATGEQLFVGALEGAQTTPAVATVAVGHVSVILAAARDAVRFHLSTTAPISAAHLHQGLAGVAGGVVVPLGAAAATMDGTAAVTGPLATALEDGLLYANVHTAAHPDGELRGQLVRPGEALFVAQLAGAQEVPPTTSTATGTVQVLLSAAGDAVRFQGATTATATAAHLHAAPGGVSGSVSVPLGPTLTGTATVTSAQAALLRSGGLYANVHTADHPGGELRGQVLRPGERLYTAVMTGAQEVPSNASTGTGGAQVIVSADGSSFFLAGAYSSLGSGATAAHIHVGAVGVGGAPVYPLTVNAGTLTLAPTAPAVGDLTALDASAWYVNVHSTDFPNGEIRGQLVPR